MVMMIMEVSPITKEVATITKQVVTITSAVGLLSSLATMYSKLHLAKSKLWPYIKIGNLRHFSHYFHILHFSNNVFFLAILPLVVLTGWAEAREPTPENTAISLKLIYFFSLNVHA